MLVMTLERVPPALRGELTRWLIEVQTGVYVGSVSATVRDLLWDKCVQNARTGRCTQMFRANNEQGFLIRLFGEQKRRLINADGYALVAIQDARHAELMRDFQPPEPLETL